MQIQLDSYSFNSILVNGSEIIYLPHKIESYLIFEENFIVLFLIDKNDSDSNRNISCYNRKGQELWKISQDASICVNEGKK